MLHASMHKPQWKRVRNGALFRWSKIFENVLNDKAKIFVQWPRASVCAQFYVEKEGRMELDELSPACTLVVWNYNADSADVNYDILREHGGDELVEAVRKRWMTTERVFGKPAAS